MKSNKVRGLTGKRFLNFSVRTGRIICQCGKGYGSELDGLCTNCRGGMTAWEALKLKEATAFKLQQVIQESKCHINTLA